MKLNPADQLRAQFAPNDRVAFSFQRKTVTGILIRTNRTRGVVRIGEDEFTVPYELLESQSKKGHERIVRIEAANRLAHELIREHGLKKWSFNFDHSTRRAGSCRYHDKTITMAFELARDGSDEDIRDTILHEIAHALVGPKHNHDRVWKAKARAIGGSGERTHQLSFAQPRWNVTCESRCWNHTAQRRNPRLICRTCGGKLVYSPYAGA